MNAQIGKAREQELLAKVAERYRGEGYEVVGEAPAFLEGRPDLVVQRGDERVVVEIKTARASAPHLREWASEIAHHPEWRLDVVVISESEGDALSVFEPQSLASLQSQIDEASQLIERGHVVAGGLLAWSCFEGVAREALARSGVRAEPVDDSASLVRLLLANNFVSDDEFRRLDEARMRRNAMVHGYSAGPGDASLFQEATRLGRELIAEAAARSKPDR